MTHSFILTVHNKDYLLQNSLERIKHFSKGNFELIIVLDGCSDNSEIIAFDFKKQNKELKIKIVDAPDVFETKANNIGLKLVESEIAIIIQDDMLINEDEWNIRLTKPFSEFNDVFAVTANCAHNWEINKNSKHILTDVNNNYEWSDIFNVTDPANRHNTPRNVFAIRQTVNRGPLAINYQDLVSLNYFDELFTPQDMDDHDLNYRMMEKLNKVVGCYWIDYISDISWGGTRTNGVTNPIILESNQKNCRIVLERHRNKIENKIIENRIL